MYISTYPACFSHHSPTFAEATKVFAEMLTTMVVTMKAEMMVPSV
jgi:hypothetical protein